jgi:hypothetical protein
MKAEKLAEILSKYPDLDVQVGICVYASPEDSVAALELNDADCVSIQKGKYPSLIITSCQIGYPDNPKDYVVVSPSPKV